MRRFALCLAFFVCSMAGFAQSRDGAWRGSIQVNGQELTMVLHLDSAARKVTMDVVEQGAMGLPMQVERLSHDSLTVCLPAMNIRYEGYFAAGKLFGMYTQGAFMVYLNFEPGDVEMHRPQEPLPPFPYQTREVAFRGGADDVLLAGTLTLPVDYREGDPVPVVLMITGSGAQNRDEELMGHRPFLVLADYLARQGIASLRYDDRGVGESSGNFFGSTTLDFEADARAGLQFLRSLGLFSRVGVVGHSEGGMIAFMLAAEGQTDFVVSMAGPAGRIDELMQAQLNLLARVQGGESEDVFKTPAEACDYLLQHSPGAWTKQFVALDISPYVGATRCPVLALGGETDLNVPPSVNTPCLEQGLSKNSHATIKVYPGLSHTFQHNASGNPALIGQIEETISPEVLRDIAQWINAL